MYGGFDFCNIDSISILPLSTDVDITAISIIYADGILTIQSLFSPASFKNAYRLCSGYLINMVSYSDLLN